MADGFRGHEVKMPRLYETEGVPFDDKEIWLHFFVLGTDSHWMAAETDGKGLYFGYAVLGGDWQNAEWGYFRLTELMTVPGMMVMCRNTVRRFADVIAEAREG